jgi:ribonuclease HII
LKVAKRQIEITQRMSYLGIRYVIGMDEAGRGPIAGPIAVGAACLTLEAPMSPRHARSFSSEHIRALFPGVNDSKQLSPASRERLYGLLPLSRPQVRHSVAFVGPAVIDHIGITRATRQAVARVLQQLALPPEECFVLLDGLLAAPRGYAVQETIIKGDGTEPIISLASIVAKVRRDRLLVRLAKRYPAYGFDQHKGYGTRAHYASIAEHGLCQIHRRSFLVSYTT